MPLKFVECPSPNHDERPGPVDILVMHYTGMKTAEDALARLTDINPPRVSAHYTVGRDGCVFRHVPEERRAWHAGVSWWEGERNVNARSIGIEIVNPGHEFGYIPFASEQIVAVIELAKGILSRHAIPPHRVVGHSDVAPARKEDPGEFFPWELLSNNGIGAWPSPPPRGEVGTAQPDRVGAEADDVAAALKRYGYGVAPDMDVPIAKVITAFQRHFRPTNIAGVWDDECATILAALIAAKEAVI
ncbi:MAG TPA: N-acetylmuramoyl-L-alanine amidase [Rhizomicrobium sp.]|jgi:N-acetylmuramoyl-L-alanine amidase|nr:N-acetylmuramoyl-L-alanine amidase [Rhizomicrobium sp.]